MKIQLIAALGAVVLLGGCAFKVTMMPRDAGTLYYGNIHQQGGSSGSVDIVIDDRTCKGNFVKVASNDSFGFYQTYGARGVTTGNFMTSGGAYFYKSLLVCSDNTGLRCDVTGTGWGSGGGICVDSKNRVYDLMFQ